MLGIVLGVVGGLVGLAIVWWSLRSLTKASGVGKMVGWGVVGVVGLAIAAFGFWYAAVGRKYSQETKVSQRKATPEVTQAVEEFGGLLVKCRDEVFPKMPYKPTEQAKAEKYASAIKAMKEELLACYTGSKGTGNEKGAELDQIKWLIEKKDCPAFAKRLIQERTFCPQMIEALVDRGKFQDPLAAAGKVEEGPSKEERAKAQQALGQLLPKLQQCGPDLLQGFVAPKGQDPKTARKAAVDAIATALKDCAAGKGDEELPAAAVEKLLKAKDCKALTQAFRNLDVCTPALEAPMKAGWQFSQQGGQQAGGQGGQQARPAGQGAKPRESARPAGRPAAAAARPRAR